MITYSEAPCEKKLCKAEVLTQARRTNGRDVGGYGDLQSAFGASLALASANPAEAAAIMRWDLVNLWARVYEMSSTHPLTALRVRAMNAQAESMHQAVQYPLPSDQRTEWGNFFLEVFLWAAPWICGALLVFRIGVRYWLTGYGFAWPEGAEQEILIFGAATWIARISYRYRGEFQSSTVGQLIQDVLVSEMRPPCRAVDRYDHRAWRAWRVLEP
jgi:hypothetical protein